MTQHRKSPYVNGRSMRLRNIFEEDFWSAIYSRRVTFSGIRSGGIVYEGFAEITDFDVDVGGIFETALEEGSMFWRRSEINGMSTDFG